ncbi:MAG TPA: UUP1 family membrane protein, partial [Syntrophorhabdaceae bacterium]|nr:UUP1 family membrane protein [Syntrophorhabdaceae bacterium]
MRRPALVAAAALMLISLVVAAYKVFSLGYPLVPSAPVYVWNLKFEGVLHGVGKNTLLLLSLPSEEHGQIVIEESIGSGNLSFSLLKEYDNRIGVWSGKTDERGEYISYRASVLFQHKGATVPRPPPPGPYPQNVSVEDRMAAMEMTKEWLLLNTPSRLQTVLRFL